MAIVYDSLHKGYVVKFDASVSSGAMYIQETSDRSKATPSKRVDGFLEQFEEQLGYPKGTLVYQDN